MKLVEEWRVGDPLDPANHIGTRIRLAAYPVGTWIDHVHGRRGMVCGTVLAEATWALWSQALSLAILFVVWVRQGIAMAATLYDPVFAVITRDFPSNFAQRLRSSPWRQVLPVRFLSR